MQLDIASLYVAMTVGVVAMAVMLPVVMGHANTAERRSQAAVVLQGIGWSLVLVAGTLVQGSLLHRAVMAVSMSSISGSLVLMASAFDIWCGRAGRMRWTAPIAALATVGYTVGFASYSFRSGWANVLLTVLMGFVVVAAARRPVAPVGRWRWMLVGAMLAQMAVTLWRGLQSGFFTEIYPSFLAPLPISFIAAIVANATSVLTLMAILLAHRDEAARELERLATIDGLTGVLNRRAWMAQAADALAASVRYHHPVAVLMLDIDHFKAINDCRGHQAGDRALSFVARALQSALRPGDLVGRYGGEEFCVLLNHADAAAAGAFDARMRAYLADVAVERLGFQLSYSAGIAMRNGPDDGLDDMLRRADSNLYGAKAQGRSRTLDAEGVRLRAVR